MADVVGQGACVITADVAPYVSGMELCSEVVEKASAQMSASFAGAELAGTGAAKSIASSFAAASRSIQQNQMVSQLETVSALFIQIGGNVSRMASLVTSSIRPVATVGTILQSVGGDAITLGLGLGAVAGGLVGMYVGVRSVEALGSAMVQLGTDAGEAGTRLEKAGLVTTQFMKEFGVLSEDEIRFTHEMRDATEAAAVAQELLSVRLGKSVDVVGVLTEAYAGLKVETANAAGRFEELTQELADFRVEIQRSIPVFGGLLEFMDEVSGPGHGNVGIFAPINEGLKSLAQTGKEASPELDRARIAIEKLVNDPALTGKVHVDEGGDLLDPLLEDAEMEKQALKDIAEGQREAARQARAYTAQLREEQQERARLLAGVQSESGAIDQLKSATAGYHKVLLGDREQIQADLDEQLRKIDELADKSNDYTTAQKAKDAAIAAAAKKTHDYDEAQKTATAHATRYWDDLSANVKQSAVESKLAIDDLLRDSKQSRIQLIDETLKSMTDTALSSLGTIAQATIDTYQTQINAGQELTKAQVIAGNRAIENQEAVSIAQAGISATLAAISTYTALTTALVFPPAAAIAAAAVGSLSFGAAVAGIRAHRPAFFTYPNAAQNHNAQSFAGGDVNGDGAVEAGEGGTGLGGLDHGGVNGGVSNASGSGSSSRSVRGGGDVTVMVRVHNRFGKLGRRGGRA